VWWAHDSSEALRILSEVRGHADRICVVAALHVPGVDLSLPKLVADTSVAPRVKVAFMSEDETAGSEGQAYDSGADGFFVKPLHEEDWARLARAVQQLALQRSSPAPAESGLSRQKRQVRSNCSRL
jgi:hypothetical protein